MSTIVELVCFALADHAIEHWFGFSAAEFAVALEGLFIAQGLDGVSVDPRPVLLRLVARIRSRKAVDAA